MLTYCLSSPLSRQENLLSLVLGSFQPLFILSVPPSQPTEHILFPDHLHVDDSQMLIFRPNPSSTIESETRIKLPPDAHIGFSLRYLHSCLQCQLFFFLIIFFSVLMRIFILFIYFWLPLVFTAVQAFSSYSELGLLSGYSVWVPHCSGFSSLGSRCKGFSTCNTQAQQLKHSGFVAGMHVKFSWTRYQAYVPCIGRWILNHWTTYRKGPIMSTFNSQLTLFLPKSLLLYTTDKHLQLTDCSARNWSSHGPLPFPQFPPPVHQLLTSSFSKIPIASIPSSLLEGQYNKAPESWALELPHFKALLHPFLCFNILPGKWNKVVLSF